MRVFLCCLGHRFDEWRFFQDDTRKSKTVVRTINLILPIQSLRYCSTGFGARLWFQKQYSVIKFPKKERKNTRIGGKMMRLLPA